MSKRNWYWKQWIDECCIMLYANMAGYAGNTISQSLLLEKIFATINNEVKYGWFCLHTNIAGFTKIITIATIDGHYGV